MNVHPQIKLDKLGDMLWYIIPHRNMLSSCGLQIFVPIYFAVCFS
jgi:hypothetical protein